jgi:hypothetical protein
MKQYIKKPVVIEATYDLVENYVQQVSYCLNLKI